MAIAEHLEFPFSVVNKRFYDSLEHYEPSSELLDIVSTWCPAANWSIRRASVWYECHPRELKLPDQGWKIHISGTRHTIGALLELVTPVLATNEVSFKFCADFNMAVLLNCKNWSRVSAGKLITIYTRGSDQLEELLETCSPLLRDFIGPYLLSDRRYKDSNVLFYRYGGFRPIRITKASGASVLAIRDSDGALIPDLRVPYFKLPPGVSDPIVAARAEVTSPSPPSTTLNDRFTVTSAIKYSPNGGLYRAIDSLTGLPVVIREARPHFSDSSDPHNPVNVLKKEARILKKLRSDRITPLLIDYFEIKGHAYLVQEEIEGDTLWGQMMQIVFVESRDSRSLLESIRTMFLKIIAGVEVFHRSNIILRDLTKTNIMVGPRNELRFIDFEFAFEQDRDDPPYSGRTPGYAAPERRGNSLPSPVEDAYALGALLVDMISFTASGLDLCFESIMNGFAQTLADFGLPESILAMARGLLQESPTLRWTLEDARRTTIGLQLGNSTAVAYPLTHKPANSVPPSSELLHKAKTTLDRTIDYLLKSCDPSRDDRLWPASFQVYLTNAISLEYGGAGVSMALHRLTGNVLESSIAWLRRHIGTDTPPGLMSGTAGVSVCLAELGYVEEAARLLRTALTDPRSREQVGLWYGSAGLGLACLHLWLASNDDSFLNSAAELADHVISSAQRDPAGLVWKTDDRIYIGLGYGGSGVALFLTYLYCLQPDSRYLAAAIAAFEADFSQKIQAQQGLVFFPTRDASVAAPKSPHTKFGTAGVGSVALRLYIATGQSNFREMAEECASSVSSRYTNKLWQEYGLAGFGEFMIDMYSATGDAKYLNTAFYHAEQLLHYSIPEDEGAAFPGADLLRISCDFALGSAGIAIFLQRLLEPQRTRMMFPDELLRRTRRQETLDLACTAK